MDPLQTYASVKLSHLIAGIAGGTVRAFLVGTNPIAAIASVVSGALTAAYMTTPIATVYAKFWKVSLDPNFEHGVAFCVGLTAMLLCEGVVKYVQGWTKNAVSSDVPADEPPASKD
jgi:hypothetical protein